MPRVARVVRFKVAVHLDGTQESTVEITAHETARGSDGVVVIRPKGKHYTYSGLLSEAAEILVARDVKRKLGR